MEHAEQPEQMVAKLYCKAESTIIGQILGSSGDVLSAAKIKLDFQPKHAKYEGLREVEDGEQLLCPRCKNPLLYRQPVEVGERPKGIYAVAGTAALG